jgi:hypothetical protein
MAISIFPTPAAAATPATPVGSSSLVFSGFMNTGNYTYGSSLAAGTYIVTFYGTAPGARYSFRAPTSNRTTILVSGDTGTITTTSSETSFNISQSLSANWSASQALGTSATTSMFFGNGLFLAGGASSSQSSNGITWSSVSNGVTQPCFAFGNSMYVVGGLNGEIKSSPDLVNWTGRTPGTSSTIQAMNFGNGLFLYGTINGGMGTSTDGITWTARTSGTTNDIFAVGYFNNQYISVGYDNVRTSPNGTTWTSRTNPFTGGRTVFSVAFGNNVYVITADAGGIATSTDAVTWTLRTSGTTNNLRSIVFGNGIFVAVGLNNTAITSTDGITWNTAAPSIAATAALQAIAFGNNTFVAAGGAGWVSITPASSGYVSVYTASAGALN